LARDPLAPGGGEEDSDRRELQVGNAVYRYEWFSLPARPGEEARLGLVLRNATDESRLQEQLIEAEKKGSLGVLTAGIGHELNNPLFGILGLGEAIQYEPNSEQVKQYAKDIVQHGKRMAGIIRDFAGVTRADTGDRRCSVELARLLDSALRLVQQSMGEWEIEVEKRYGSLPPINALGEELLQAFVNVILNAAQAMKGKGRLAITAEQGPVLIQITVHDSGPGISKPHLLKIFDPFFTTKQQGQGSGLGLTIARRLLMKNGGHIRMESTPGQGASCIITFPIPQDAARTEGKG
jgi:signal transduction histidine kinase